MFEYDPAKSAANKAKHGIDFEEAQALWLDDRRVVVRTFRVDASEDRWLVIGQVLDRIWTTVVTYRGDVTRIISTRRSRDEEVELYERQTPDNR